MAVGHVGFPYVFVKTDDEIQRNTVIGHEHYNLKWTKPDDWQDEQTLPTFYATYHIAELVDPGYGDSELSCLDQERLAVVGHEQSDVEAFICMYRNKPHTSILNKFSTMLSNSFKIHPQHKIIKYIKSMPLKYSSSCLLTHLTAGMSKAKADELGQFDKARDDMDRQVEGKLVDVLPRGFDGVNGRLVRPRVMFVRCVHGCTEMAKMMVKSIEAQSEYRLKALLFDDLEGIEKWQASELNLIDHLDHSSAIIRQLVFERPHYPFINND